MNQENSRKGLLIYGGSFNPIHIGHLRLAIEARECLRHFIGKIDFIPAFSHPWKEDTSLLPFNLRVKMVRAAIEYLPQAFCNVLEEGREGPSYTLDTIKEYSRKYNREDLYFLVGSEDFKLLPKWHRGLEIIDFCNIVVAPRGLYSITDFKTEALDFSPGAVEDKDIIKNICLYDAYCLKTERNTRIFYLSIPWLDISASRIRKLWLEDYNIDFLVPWAVIEILDKDKMQVRQNWL